MSWESALSGCSLAMDAFAVSLCVGATTNLTRGKYPPSPLCEANRRALSAACRLALACGLFQFFMPLLGCFLGEYSTRWFPAIDHWIAFVLLAFVGGDMVWGYFKDEAKEIMGVADRLWPLLSVAVATSIDALVVGAGFALAGLPVMELAVIAGVVTALACAAGVCLGRFVGARFGKKMELMGGVLLIFIGLEVLVSHLMDHGRMPF
ncbi:MAG: manganese efflux pump MntP family protein [Fretibacterium sp.]|nr:manganese efflux pump MntP family protein [Fretibacterium sp.]